MGVCIEHGVDPVMLRVSPACEIRVVSTSTALSAYFKSMEGRVRLSRGSLDWQTSQLHPIVGTPIEVPLPSTVRLAIIVYQYPWQARAGAGAQERW